MAARWLGVTTALPLLLVATMAAVVVTAHSIPVGQRTATPRFQQTAGAAGTVADSSVSSGAAASAAAAGAASASSASSSSAAESDAAHGRTRGGGEWWLKDPPWFLPPPPEWGPMPPTMYTSYFHKPRYPSLSTANYYPLYSREDEYDAHLPASMSRRAAYTQQQLFDHYTATYRDHLNTPGVLAPGDPNMGVSNPTLYADHFLGGAMAGDAHARAQGMAHPNSYFPQYAGGNAGRMLPQQYVNGYGPAMAMSGAAFVETAATARPHVSRTQFVADTQPRFADADAEEADDADADAEDADEVVEESDAESVETEVSDSDSDASEAEADDA